MTKNEKSIHRDLAEKADEAKQAAEQPAATARDKADAKLLEQEAAAAKMREKHPPKMPAAANPTDAKLDKALKDSFPSSDAIAPIQPAAKPKK